MPYLLGSYNPLHVLAYISWLALFFFSLFSRSAKDISISIIGRIFPLLLLLMFICIYVPTVVVINGNADLVFNLTYRFAMILVEVIPISIFFSILFSRFGFNCNDLVDNLIAVALIQSSIAFATLIFPELRYTILTVMARNGLDLRQFGFLGYRGYGIATNFTFAMPVFHAIMAVLSFSRALKGHFSYYLFCLPLLFTAIINARIGLFLFAFGVFLVVIQQVGRRKKILRLVVSFLILFLVGISVVPIVANLSPLTAEWIMTSIEEVRTFLLEGSNEGYFSVVSNMFHLPGGFHLFFGVGNTPFGGQMYGLVPNSDVGYVIDIYIGGLLLSVMLGIFLLFLTVRAIKYCRECREDLIIVFLIIMLANVKGVVFRPQDFFNAYILICVFAIAYGTRRVDSSGNYLRQI